jgi:hypothetical protein
MEVPVRALVQATVLALAAAGCATGPMPAARPSTVHGVPGPLRGGSTAELAGRFLPPPVASRIVAHEIGEPGSPPVYGATFYTAPAPHPDGTCRRERYYVPVSPAGNVSQPVSTWQVALARDCRLRAGGFFVNLQPAHRFEDALAALHRFREVRAAARAGAPLPFTLTCRSFRPPGTCSQEARLVLAGLPLDRIHIVEPGAGGGWRVSVMPKGPGQPYWDVRLVDGPDGRVGQVTLSWDIPAPF